MGSVARFYFVVLLLAILVGCGGGGGGTPDPEVKHPTVAPAMAGEVTHAGGASSVTRGTSADNLIVRIVVRNNNPAGVDVELIRYCLKHDPAENSPLTKTEAQGYLNPVPANLPANVDVQQLGYTGSPQTIEISQFKGAPLTPTDRYWLSAVFVSSDGAAGPVTEPLRFKVLYKYQLVEPPAVGILKTFTGHVYDDQGELLPNAFVQYFHEGVFLEADVTDDAGVYNFEVEVPPVNSGSGVRQKSAAKQACIGEADGETQCVLKAYHPDYSWEPTKYLDPEFVSYEVDLSFQQGGSGLADSAWPMFRHDQRHTGRSQYVGSQTGKLKWAYTTEGGIASSPSIGTDGTIYVGCDDGKLYAIDQDGSLKWSSSLGFIGKSSPVLGIDGTIYIGSDQLYAISPLGNIKWSHNIGTYDSSPTLGESGALYATSWNGMLYADNLQGTTDWIFDLGDTATSSPAISSSLVIYVGSHNGKLYAINADGSLRWSCITYGEGWPIDSSPAIGDNGTIYIGSWTGGLYAFGPDGVLKWSFNEDSVDSSPAIGIDGTVYVGSGMNKLYAINSNGTKKWEYTTGNSGVMYSSPAIGADGTVYIGSPDHKLWAIDSDGVLKWSYATEKPIWSSPAIGADGTVYIGSTDGKLYAFGD